MVKKSIGIDIGRHHVRAVQIARTADGLQIERVFGLQTRRSTDSPADVLRSLTTEHGFDRHAEVVVSLPHHGVFYADVEINGPAFARLRSGDTSMVKDSFPVETEDTVIQVCSARPAATGHRVVLAAASRQSIDQELRWLKEAKIRPAIMDTSINAIQLAVATNHPEIVKGTALIVCMDEFMLSLAVTEEGQLVQVRNIPVRSRREQTEISSAQELAGLLRSEIQITWRKLFGVEPDSELRMFLVSSPRTALPLVAAIEEQMDCHVTSVDPYAGVGRLDEETAECNICVAEGLALRAFITEQGHRPDFLAAYRTRVKPGVSFQKELALCACLGATIVVVWAVGLYLQLARLEARYATTKTQIEQVFLETLPEEKNIISPSAQLKQKLDSLQADYAAGVAGRQGYANPLEVLCALGAHPPGEGDLVLDDMFIAGDSVRLRGNCKSFTALSQWQRTLEQIPGFEVVEVPNPRKDASTGKVQFSLSLSCGKAVQ